MKRRQHQQKQKEDRGNDHRQHGREEQEDQAGLEDVVAEEIRKALDPVHVHHDLGVVAAGLLPVMR